MSFSRNYLQKVAEVAALLDCDAIDRAVALLRKTRDRGGRLFIIGSGGGAGHASHAACDFRKLAGIETYAPADNVSELTARINDEGWESSLANCLMASRLNDKDSLLVFSVGGGNQAMSISVNLVNAMRLAKERAATLLAIVGRDGGFAAKAADACILVPTVEANLVTPLAESFQAVVWHLLVSHPELQVAAAKWESTR